MTCVVCDEEFYPQSNLEPAEPCWCGEMARGASAWDWDRWRGVKKRLRFKLARRVIAFASWLTS
jgi:hypothetical protein